MLATVCTTFIWTVLKSMGISLEGSVLEPEELNAGAEPHASTLDCFYLRTGPEQDASAEWWRTLFTAAPTDLARLGKGVLCCLQWT